MLGSDIETIDDLPATGRGFGQAVVERDGRLSQIKAQFEVLQQSTDPSTKVKKAATILAFAANKAADDGKVAVTPVEVRGCTGVSRQYAYDLVDAIAADVDSVCVRESH